MLGYNWKWKTLVAESHICKHQRGEGKKKREALTSLLTSVKIDWDPSGQTCKEKRKREEEHRKKIRRPAQYISQRIAQCYQTHTRMWSVALTQMMHFMRTCGLTTAFVHICQ